jgi:hypothetical protein
MITRSHPKRLRRGASVAAAVLATLSLAACGAADEGAADSGTADDGEVASIGTTIADASSGDSGATGDASAGDDSSESDSSRDEPDEADIQEAALEFAKCMREHGIDMPDPVFDGEGAGPGGGVMIQAGGPGESIDPQEMDAANEACQPIMEAVRGAFEPPDPEELERMKAEALEFSQCMREHGVDMPDPQFSEDGAMTVAVGGGRLGESGEGPDPVDADKFNEAAEACGGPGGGMLSVSPDDADGSGDEFAVNVQADSGNGG